MERAELSLTDNLASAQTLKNTLPALQHMAPVVVQFFPPSKNIFVSRETEVSSRRNGEREMSLGVITLC